MSTIWKVKGELSGQCDLDTVSRCTPMHSASLAGGEISKFRSCGRVTGIPLLTLFSAFPRSLAGTCQGWGRLGDHSLGTCTLNLDCAPDTFLLNYAGTVLLFR